MGEPVQLADLEAAGVTITEYEGPAIRITGAWVWAAAVLVAGTAIVSLRASARGRHVVWWFPPAIYVTLGLLLLALLARQVYRLRRWAGRDSRLSLLGWGVGGVARIAGHKGTGPRGWRGGLGSPVVGLLFDRHGLAVLVDQAGVGLVRPTSDLRLAIGHRGRRRWLMISQGDQEVVLRLFGARIP